ncbi:MAG TPA: hypothetical protein VFV02_04080 [Acidimicrobiales bacterium]|nr:hypothetical protein [Acidimicrobiales bacterium]
MESPEEKGLSRDEDDSLRRLAWFAETVGVSHWARTRIDELRRRDRRAEIRPPREEVIAACAADILQRAEPRKVPSRFATLDSGATEGLDGGATHPAEGLVTVALSTAGPAEALGLSDLRKKRRRRHPWTFLRGAKGS